MTERVEPLPPGPTTRRDVLEDEEEPGSGQDQVLTVDGQIMKLSDAMVAAQRMFWGGCFALPWLWGISVWFFWPELKRRRHPVLLKYVTRGAAGCAAWITVLLAWVLVYQIGREKLLGSAFRKMDVQRFPIEEFGL
ncbi:unnamed protein product [Pedinophyceae sp. YPF-701]|nr:unnamed protein product [Pedinophyceae sp. YPF-701]